ncbi:TrmB family transcriptional regulator [Methanosarcina sp. KYL-1]|uniref:TrmB family transcriptional regulator n=1 Tax=Methanosarcina sp. KYL-1 TaxID=2602068 RepID=UPI002100711B|nr:TrmB family transcriptional regulator [Methanosarcina sp. KYL-1]
MQKKKLLQDLGLNAYEAAAYLSLLKFGVSDASTVYRDAEVPYGKIYTVLESLAGKGFVEVQESRPKKFRGIDPELALDAFFEKRKAQAEREMAVLKGAVEEAKEALKAVPAQKRKNEVFWTTAITESEIKKFATSVYREVKKSLSVIPPALGMPVIAFLIPEITRALDRGVRVRLLISPRFMSLVSVLSLQEEETLATLKKGLELRMNPNFDSYFGVVDESIVVLFQPHPKDKDQVLSVVKIWDAGLAKNLNEEFELMWDAGERIDLEEKLQMEASRKLKEVPGPGKKSGFAAEPEPDPEEELDPGEVFDPEEDVDLEEVFDLEEDVDLEEELNPGEVFDLEEELDPGEVFDLEEDLDLGEGFDLDDDLDLEEGLGPEEELELKEKLERIKNSGSFA